MLPVVYVDSERLGLKVADEEVSWPPIVVFALCWTLASNVRRNDGRKRGIRPYTRRSYQKQYFSRRSTVHLFVTVMVSLSVAVAGGACRAAGVPQQNPGAVPTGVGRAGGRRDTAALPAVLAQGLPAGMSTV